MPAPQLAVDWEAVKAHAIREGVTEAAEAFGINLSAVKSRSSREKWLADAGKSVVVQPVPKSMQPIATNATRSPSEAAKYSVESIRVRSKYHLMKAIGKGAKALARKEGDAIVDKAQNLNQLATAHAKLCPEAVEGGPQTILNFAFLGQGDRAGAVEHEEKPVIDVSENIGG